MNLGTTVLRSSQWLIPWNRRQPECGVPPPISTQSINSGFPSMHRCCGEYRDAGTALRCGLGWATTKRERAQGAPPRAALGCEGSVVPTPHTQGRAAGMTIRSRGSGHSQESARGLQAKRWEQKPHVTVEEGRVWQSRLGPDCKGSEIPD